jgi:GAF domain-containing protein
METFSEKQIEYVTLEKRRSSIKYLEQISEHLKNSNKKFNWVGFYVLENNKLKLEAFKGLPTIHTEISLGDGLCSQAIVKDSIINEPDVQSNSTYLACSIDTKSELVVPIRFQGKPIGEIDIDSDTKNAFDKEDEELLNQIAEEVKFFVKNLSD